MAYDPVLADRIRSSLAGISVVREVNMFGGLSFLVNDKIAIAATTSGDLLVRCYPDRMEQLLDRKGAGIAQMGSRTMSKGWLRVESAGIETDAELDFWIETALEFNAAQTR